MFNQKNIKSGDKWLDPMFFLLNPEATNLGQTIIKNLRSGSEVKTDIENAYKSLNDKYKPELVRALEKFGRSKAINELGDGAIVYYRMQLREFLSTLE